MRHQSSDWDLLTVAEVAARLKVAPHWVYQHADDLGVFRVGKYLRFDWDRVRAQLERGVGGERNVGPPTQRPPSTSAKREASDEQGTV